MNVNKMRMLFFFDLFNSILLGWFRCFVCSLCLAILGKSIKSNIYGILQPIFNGQNCKFYPFLFPFFTLKTTIFENNFIFYNFQPFVRP